MKHARACLAIAAALDGLGVGLLSRPLVAGEIAAGRLVAPFAISIARSFAYYIVTPEAIADRPAVAAFRAWLLEEATAVRVTSPVPSAPGV